MEGMTEGLVTAAAVREALDGLEADEPVMLEVNSPGGVAAEGVAIYNLLRTRKVEAVVTGMAYSAASFALMAADRVTMQAGTTLMIHGPWRVTLGDENAHRKSLNDLVVATRQYAAVYAARARRPVAEIKGLMEEETYFDGPAAVKAGLADAAEAPKRRAGANRAAAAVARAHVALSGAR